MVAIVTLAGMCTRCVNKWSGVGKRGRAERGRGDKLATIITRLQQQDRGVRCAVSGVQCAPFDDNYWHS